MKTVSDYETFLIAQTKNLSKQNISNKYTKINIEELEFIKNNIGLTVSEKEFLFDLLNFISIGTNLIVNKQGVLINQSELSVLLKIEPRSLQRKFKSLIEKRLIHPVKDWNKIYYIINPNLCHCEFVMDQVYELFNMLGYKKDSYKNKIVKFKDKKIIITKEKVLETLLSNNLNQIEEGLILIKTQYEVDCGFIDILAKDKTGTITIIEVKIKSDDPKLVEQCVYYPTQFSENIRMITIAPSYTSKLYNTLNSLGYVEIKNYDINENNLIINDFRQIV